MSIPLPNLPGILFAYDAREGVKLQPLEPASIGLFDYAVDTVDGIVGPLMSRRRMGTDPYRAMQVPFNPASGINGYPAAYAPAFDMRADQQSNLEMIGLDVDMGGEVYTASFIVLAMMRAPTVSDARLLSMQGSGDLTGGSDDGNRGAMVFTREAVTNSIMTGRYPPVLRGEFESDPLLAQVPEDKAGTHFVSTPIVLDQLYRFGAVFTEPTITQYLDNVAVGSVANLPTPFGATAKFALGGQANGFNGHCGVSWDGPIVFAIGSNKAWNAVELAEIDAWIVEEFNL
jgi:hypothetical protein